MRSVLFFIILGSSDHFGIGSHLLAVPTWQTFELVPLFVNGGFFASGIFTASLMDGPVQAAMEFRHQARARPFVYLSGIDVLRFQAGGRTISGMR